MSTTANPLKFGKHKVIVCGTRTFEDYEFVKKKLDFYLSKLPKEYTELVSGCAKGPDTLAVRYGEENKYKVWRFAPEWNRFGKLAGLVRNTMMAEFSTHCIAFWDGKSSGTRDMIEKAKAHNLVVRIIRINQDAKTV